MIETYSAMVALYPDEVTKQIISRLMAGREGAYNPEDLHCTIVFLAMILSTTMMLIERLSRD